MCSMKQYCSYIKYILLALPFIVWVSCDGGAIENVVPADDDGILVRFTASIDAFDSDSEIVPMAMSGGEVAACNNFTLKSVLIYVYRQVDGVPGQYQLVKTVNRYFDLGALSSYKSRSFSHANGEKYTFADFGIDQAEVILPPGNYIANLFINGPFGAENRGLLPYGTICTAETNVLGVGDYCFCKDDSRMGETYFQYKTFSLYKDGSLGSGDNGAHVVNFDNVKRKASPIRLIYYGMRAPSGDLNRPIKFRFHLYGRKNEIPSGMNFYGEPLYSEDSSEGIVQLSYRVTTELHPVNLMPIPHPSLFFPYYAPTELTSIFIPFFDEMSDHCSVNLYVEDYYFQYGENNPQNVGLQFDDILVERNRINTFCLDRSSGLFVLHRDGDGLGDDTEGHDIFLKNIISEYKAKVGDAIPFKYVEHNIPAIRKAYGTVTP